MGRDPFHWAGLLRALYNPALDISKDGAAPASLGKLCKGHRLVENLLFPLLTRFQTQGKAEHVGQVRKERKTGIQNYFFPTPLVSKHLPLLPRAAQLVLLKNLP